MHDVHENTISQFHTYIYTLYKWHFMNAAMINIKVKTLLSIRM